MQNEVQAALINVGRALVYAVLAVAAMVGFAPDANLGFGALFIWWSGLAVWAMPNRFNVVLKGSK